MNLSRMAIALGSAASARRLINNIQGVGIDDVLGSVGLERRRSAMDKILPALGYIGLGTVIGAGAALLLAPSSGKELRAKVQNQLEDAKTRVDNGLRSVEARAESAAQDVMMRSNNGG